MNLIDEWRNQANAKGITFRELAKIAGIDESTLQRWKTKLPKAVQVYIKIQKVLQTK